VTFAVRPRRRDVLARDGLVVHSILGDYARPARTVDANDIDGSYDAVVLACKGYDLAEAMDNITPAMGAGSVILPFLNGLGPYAHLDERFGRNRVLGGVAYIAVEVDERGAIRHQGEGDTVLLGARSPETQAAAQALFDLFKAGPGTRQLAADIAQALWDKWTMLASGAALTCLMRGTIGQILDTAAGRALAGRAIAECEAVAAAAGHAVQDASARRTRSLLLAPSSPWMASMARDMARGAVRIEDEEIIGDMARLAQRHGVDAPLLGAAHCHLQVYAAQTYA